MIVFLLTWNLLSTLISDYFFSRSKNITMGENECNIKVICRVRPLNSSEERAGSKFVLKFPSEESIGIGVRFKKYIYIDINFIYLWNFHSHLTLFFFIVFIFNQIYHTMRWAYWLFLLKTAIYQNECNIDKNIKLINKCIMYRLVRLQLHIIYYAMIIRCVVLKHIIVYICLWSIHFLYFLIS